MLLLGSSAKIRHVKEGRWAEDSRVSAKGFEDGKYALVVSNVDRLVYINLVVKIGEGWVCCIEVCCVMLTPCFLIRHYHEEFSQRFLRQLGDGYEASN